jgi:hypothetical protein
MTLSLLVIQNRMHCSNTNINQLLSEALGFCSIYIYVCVCVRVCARVRVCEHWAFASAGTEMYRGNEDIYMCVCVCVRARARALGFCIGWDGNV